MASPMAIQEASGESYCSPCKRRRVSPTESCRILGRLTDELSEHYAIGKELGRGQFGVIRHCINKKTGESFACKTIPKERLTGAQDVEDVRKEIDIMWQLSGHPNTVGLKDVYEDKECVHIVMELCGGGELFDRIVKRKSYPENEAAFLIKSLVKVLKFCHARGIMHRDLKPENILLATTSPYSPIKLADFGLALRFVPGQKFTGMAGSAYYIAPEVLNGSYSQEIDMWSIGVILYVLISGVPPFWGETEQVIFDAIKDGNIDFQSDPWERISIKAKDLIRGLLCSDATARLTPEQVLRHPWIVLHTSQPVQSQSMRDCLEESRAHFVEEVAARRFYRIEATPIQINRYMPGNHFLNNSEYMVGRSLDRAQSGADFTLPRVLGASTEDLSDSFSPASIPMHREFDLSPVSPLPSSILSLSLLSTNVHCSLEVREESELSPILATRDAFTNSYSPSSALSSLSPRQVDFDKWASFSQVAEPTFRDLLETITATGHSFLQPLLLNSRQTLLQDQCTFSILKANGDEIVVVDSANGKFLVVHDTERRRIGWKVLEPKEAIATNPSTLCWSPCPHFSNKPALTHTQLVF